MERLEAAIMRTLLYADIFSFAMTPVEIHRHLISNQPATLTAVRSTLAKSPHLQKLLRHEQGFYALANRAGNITHRLQREQYVQALWDDALRYGHWFAQIPFVRMVALTGALAVRNPVNEADDYDYLLVTQPGRVWLARAAAIVLVRIVRRRGRELCPNYVLAADQLEQQRRDLFMAREIAQMVPIYGADVYQQMMAANAWVYAYLPNATPFRISQERPQRLKSLLEWCLGGWLGDKLERWEYERKRRRFEAEARKPQSAAVIDAGHVKGHFNDNGQPVMEQYLARLQEYNLLADDIREMAGD